MLVNAALSALTSEGRMTPMGSFFPLLFFKDLIVDLDVGVANIGHTHGRRMANIG